MIQETSRIANENFKPKRQTDYDKILSVMESEINYTYNEIAVKLGWNNPNKVSRRMAELERKNEVKTQPNRLCKVARSLCKTYLII